jgi:hypothetical protein
MSATLLNAMAMLKYLLIRLIVPGHHLIRRLRLAICHVV